VTEVERFFRRLVSTLVAGHPARLQGPLLLDDITGSILPYRAHRRALELDTVEDYEAVLLRLCAGEGDLVWAEPEEARERFIAESRSNNPDLTALYAFEHVYLTLRPEPLLWALAPDPRSDQASAVTREAYTRAYPEPAPEVPDPEAAPADVALDEPVLVLGAARLETPPPLDESDGGAILEVPQPPPPTCLFCGGSLPTGRTVNFCPHCGESQTRILCPECRSELEPGWRHCVNCGAAVGEA
jgi:predicted RNA-binding Zn-ribbon protein involved in translation (DUF1610 family)